MAQLGRLKTEGNAVVLCPICVPFSCCPKVSLKKNKFLIEDDFGSSINLSKKQLLGLVDDINKITELSGSSLDN